MSQEFWNREELYELVWSKPFTQLAKEYTISDVGLRKICIRLEIPVPESGYWAKVRNGKKVKRAPLPPSTRNETAIKPDRRLPSELMEDDGPYIPPILDDNLKDAYIAALAFEAAPENRINVLSRTPQTPRGTKTLLALQKPRRKEDILPEIPVGAYGLRVSETMAERAVAIAEALELAFGQRGWNLTLGTERNPFEMRIEVFGRSIPFWIEEVMERKNHVLSKEEEKDKIKKPWNYSYARYDYLSTGMLVLKLGERSAGYTSPGYRTKWADGKYKRIETELNYFCRECIIVAIKLRNDEIKSEIREREFKVEEKKRREREYLQSLDERRRKDLVESLNRYDLMLQTRAYIAHVREKAVEQKVAIEGDLAAWINWAEDFAVRCDPINEKFPKYEMRSEWEIRLHAGSN